jgi:hypothetical protein
MYKLSGMIMHLTFKLGAIALIIGGFGLVQVQSAVAEVKTPAVTPVVTPVVAPPVKKSAVAPLVKKPALVNNCKKGESMFLSVETKTYNVNICGGDLAHDMVLVKKSDKSMARHPLAKAEPKMFEASGDGNMYLLVKGAIKGDIFTVTKVVYEELLREPIKGW